MSPRLERSARLALWVGIASIPLTWLVGTLFAWALGAILGAISGRDPGDALSEFGDTTMGFAAAIVVGQGSFVLLLWLALRRDGEPWRKRLGLAFDPERWTPRLWVPLAFGTLGVLMVSRFFLSQIFGADTEYGDAIQGGVKRAGVAARVAFALLMTLLPAFLEEALYRGFVLRGLLRGYRPGFALTLTALLFAFVHPDPSYAVQLLPLAVWLGWVSYRTNSIAPTIWCHFVNNAFGVAMIVVLAVSGFDPSAVQPESPEKAPLWMAFAGAAVVVFLLFCIVSFFRATKLLGLLPDPPDPRRESAAAPA